MCEQAVPYFQKRAKQDDGLGKTYLGILYRLDCHDLKDLLFKHWQNKENATSVYNVSADLRFLTHYNKQECLDIIQEIDALVKNRKMEISNWTKQNIENMKNEIMRYKP